MTGLDGKVRVFEDRVFTSESSEADALRWALDMELNHGWTCSRITKLTVGHVALVWRWIDVEISA